MPLSRITFADPFPPGLAVAANPSRDQYLWWGAVGGTVRARDRLREPRLPADGTCTVQRERDRNLGGVKNNTTTIVTSSAVSAVQRASMTVTP